MKSETCHHDEHDILDQTLALATCNAFTVMTCNAFGRSLLYDIGEASMTDSQVDITSTLPSRLSGAAEALEGAEVVARCRLISCLNRSRMWGRFGRRAARSLVSAPT